MRTTVNAEKFLDNNLAIGYVWPDRKTVIQGKRVSKLCPVTVEERRAYVRSGAPSAIKLIRQRLSCGLVEAHDILQLALGQERVPSLYAFFLNRLP